jgi:MYXO-CTERM domain-containing protein
MVQRSGTAVGNPGDLDAKTSRTDEGVTLERVEVPVAELALSGCGLPGLVLPQPVVLDGLAPSAAPVAVPAGRWCGMELVLAGPVVVVGATEAGTAFTVALDPFLALDGRLEIDGQSLLLDLPLALDAAELDARGPVVDLPADDPLAELWAADTVASLYEDRDGDGLLSGPDRVVLRGDAGLFHTGASPSDQPPSALSSEEGCGCASSDGAPVAGLVALLLVRRRRRVN